MRNSMHILVFVSFCRDKRATLVVTFELLEIPFSYIVNVVRLMLLFPLQCRMACSIYKSDNSKDQEVSQWNPESFILWFFPDAGFSPPFELNLSSLP